jgi:hypothetical protein
MVPTNQRWAFIFERPPDNQGVRANGSAQLLINVVNGIIRPFTILDSSIDDDHLITYRLIPDEGYKDDPQLETELMPITDDQFGCIIIEEVTDMGGTFGSLR